LTLGVHEDLRTRLRLPSSQYRCLIASQSVKGDYRIREAIVGTVEIKQHKSFLSGLSRPYICNLAVKSSHRRQGIARQLLLKCEQIAREWEAKELTLHVLDNNHAARQLYLASGYQIEQVETNLSYLLWQQPRRILLQKLISSRAKIIT
jgi:ribosomal protein S18 acetylase RimI-like enzyme